MPYLIMNRRGQEEAPIELLIAVTVLTFVMIVGYLTYQHLSSTQFEQKMHSVLSKFARDIELVYRGAVGTSWITRVDFTPIGRTTLQLDSVTILQPSTRACQNALGRNDCLALSLIYVEETTNEKIPGLVEVLDIPADVVIKFQKPNPQNPNQLECDVELSEQSYSAGRIEGIKNNKECYRWTLTMHAFRITKEDPNEIVIEELS